MTGAQAGMVLGVLGYFFFALHDASNKWLVATLPVWEVLFVRSVIILVASLAIGRRRVVEELMASRLKLPMALRGVLTLTAWQLYFTASRSMPLAQLLTLYFAAPLVITLLSAPILGEKVTRMRWICVVVGFLGVLVASDPFGVRLSWPTLLVLAAACLWGYGVILMRQIARKESTLLQMIASNLVFTVVTGTACLIEFVPPTIDQGLLLLGVGVFGGLGQVMMFEAARRAPAAVMATVEYSALLWAFTLGFLVWHDVPVLAVWAGAGLILFAGLLLVVNERRAA
jgi:drug/metabolite transporter (DMT)-like permease